MFDSTSVQQDIDELDRKILGLLLEDARRPYADIGAQVGLSAPSVHGRVRRLEGKGVIRGYSAQLNREAIGFGIAAIVAIKPSSGYHWEELEQAFVAMQEVETCYSVSGASTYLLLVRVGNPAALESLLRSIASLAGVAGTETMLILSTTFERQRVR